MANPSVVVDFVANTKQLVAGVKELSGATDQAAGSVKKVDWKRIALWGAGAAAVGAGVKFLKDATTQTEDLAKSTLALQRVTGMDTETASQWAEVLKSRNIDVGTFNKSMVLMSKQMVAAADGSAKSADAFKQLGVDMADVRAGDTQKVLMEVSDGLAAMPAGARKAALTQQLLGRSSQQLTPLLYGGSQAIQEQLDMAKRYGAELGENTTAGVKQMIADQREMQMAMDGVKVQVGTALVPVLVTLSGALTDVVRVMQPILTSGTAVKVMLGVLVVAFAAYKIAVIAATIASSPLITVLGAISAPVWIAIAAIAALIAIGVLLWKNWDTVSAGLAAAWGAIQAAAMAVFDWLKANWPLVLGIITGPMGLAVALIVTHWDRVKQVTTAAWGVVTSAVSSALATVRSLVSGFTGWFSGAWDVVRAVLSKVAGWFSIPVDAARSAVAAIKGAWQGLVSFLEGIVSTIGGIASRVANAMRAPINALIGAWNGLSFTVPSITIPGFGGVKIAGKQVVPSWGGTTIGGQSFPFPKIPKLARGGVFDSPTLALIGEGAGREIVAPEALLRSIVASMTPQVRVYIGDTELRDLVRVEAVSVDNATAAALLGGMA